jgi:O-succinylbenzoate synthase
MTTVHFDEAIPFAVPLRRRFRGVTHREGVLLRNGRLWGEWAPFAEYDDQVAARWLAAALEASTGQWPSPVRDGVDINAIIPAVSAEDAYQLAQDAVLNDGCRVIKVKVAEAGQDFQADVERIAAVRKGLDDVAARQARIRIDVNGAWSTEEAIERLQILDALADGLEYAEQPCGSLVEMAQVKEQVSVPLAVDEGVRLAGAFSDVMADQIRNSADVLILKAIPLGGVQTCLQLAAEIGLPVTVSGSLDTSIGLSSGLALAAALPDEPRACGLGTGRLLAGDLTERTLLPEQGRLSPMRLQPDPAALAQARIALSADRVAWWNDRLMRVRNLLESGASW